MCGASLFLNCHEAEPAKNCLIRLGIHASRRNEPGLKKNGPSAMKRPGAVPKNLGSLGEDLGPFRIYPVVSA